VLGLIIIGKWIILSICSDARWAADARGYGFDLIAMRGTSRFSSSGRYCGSTSAGSSSAYWASAANLALEAWHGRKGNSLAGTASPLRPSGLKPLGHRHARTICHTVATGPRPDA
jgi:hypothetical protein